MMNERKLRRADLVTAPLMLLLGGWAVFEGLRMPLGGTYAGKPIYWYTSPGFFPILIGSLIVACSVGVFLRAWATDARHGFKRRWAVAVRRFPHRVAVRRALLVLMLIGSYIAGISLNPFGSLSQLIETKAWAHLVWTRFLTDPDGMNYALCSALFLILFFLRFHRPRSGKLTWRSRAALSLFAVTMTWAVSFVFSEVLYTPLP